MSKIYKSHKALCLSPERLRTTFIKFELQKRTIRHWHQHGLKDTRNTALVVHQAHMPVILQRQLANSTGYHRAQKCNAAKISEFIEAFLISRLQTSQTKPNYVLTDEFFRACAPHPHSNAHDVSQRIR